MAFFGTKPRQTAVLNHWIAFADGFDHSPQEFYANVGKQLEARRIPGMDISHVEFAEGGILSGKRIYMRMLRERLAFDACAAPFGAGFFFSCRTVYVPAKIELWHLLAIALIFGLFYCLLLPLLGSAFAVVTLAGLALAVCMMFRATVALGLSDIDRTLLKAPIIGPIYEGFFRKETYYREDTRLLYLDAVPRIIKDLAEEVTAAKGIKLVRQYEQAPILGELYKHVPPKEA